jgi:hypothetical protein
MPTIRRLIGLLIGGTILAAIGAAMAAMSIKRSTTPKHDPEADEVRLVAIFGPLAFRSRARAFRGGTIDCWFGGGLIDLRDATLDPAGATLEVKTIFGGAQLVVPADWQVTTRVVGLGGAGDGRPAMDRPADAPRLTIEGVAAFGGIGVTSELSEEAFQQVEVAVERQAKRNGRHKEPNLEAVV